MLQTVPMNTNSKEARYRGLLPKTLEATRQAKPEMAERIKGMPVRAVTDVYDSWYKSASWAFTVTKMVLVTPINATINKSDQKFSSFFQRGQF